MQSALEYKVHLTTDSSDNEDLLRISNINHLLQEPARFIIVAQLYLLRSTDFLFLLRQTSLTSGNLSWHLNKLKTAGYVTIQKEFLDNKSHTTIQLTDKGRSAFEQYCRVMGQFLDKLARQQQGDSRRPEVVSGTTGTTCHALENDKLGLPPPEVHDGDKVTTLRRSPIFSDLEEEQLVEFSQFAVERHLKAGQFIFLEGDLVEHFYLVAEGRVKILKHSPSGKDFVMAFSGPGEMFGTAALHSVKTQPCSAQAVIDTRVLAIRNDDLLSFLTNTPEVGFRILRRMSIIVGSRLRTAMRRLADLSAEKAEHRLAFLLHTLSLEYGLTLPFTREEVAQMAGTSTETAVRFVNHLKKIGVLRPLRRKVIILNQTKLQSLIGVSHKTAVEGHIR